MKQKTDKQKHKLTLLMQNCQYILHSFSSSKMMFWDYLEERKKEIAHM